MKYRHWHNDVNFAAFRVVYPPDYDDNTGEPPPEIDGVNIPAFVTADQARKYTYLEYGAGYRDNHTDIWIHNGIDIFHGDVNFDVGAFCEWWGEDPSGLMVTPYLINHPDWYIDTRLDFYLNEWNEYDSFVDAVNDYTTTFNGGSPESYHFNYDVDLSCLPKRIPKDFDAFIQGFDDFPYVEPAMYWQVGLPEKIMSIARDIGGVEEMEFSQDLGDRVIDAVVDSMYEHRQEIKEISSSISNDVLKEYGYTNKDIPRLVGRAVDSAVAALRIDKALDWTKGAIGGLFYKRPEDQPLLEWKAQK